MIYRSKDLRRQLNRSTDRSIGILLPDLVQLALVVEREQSEHEDQQKSDGRVTRARQPSRDLRPADALSCLVHRDKRRDAAEKGARNDREYRERGFYLDPLVEVPQLVVDLVPSDVAVDAQRDQRQAQPDGHDIAPLTDRTHSSAPLVFTVLP